MSADEPLLRVRGLEIEFHDERRRRRRTIVAGMELDIDRGETVAIVGESGSGKSLSARAIMGLLPPGVRARGEVRFKGRDLLAMRERQRAALRGSELGMLLQDPFTMLNPLLHCGKHIEEVLGGSRSGRREETLRRLREVGIVDADIADRFPFQLSGGMRQRVALAATLAGDPDLLIADEPSTALDVTTQAEILALLKSLQVARGMALVLITHDLRVAFSVCDRVYVLYAGSLLEVAPAAALESEPLHPYTLGLLLSEPPVDRRLSSFVAIEGSVPEPDEVAAICAFAPRCAWVADSCRAARPQLVEVAAQRRTACIRIDEIRGDLRTQHALVQDHQPAVVGARLGDPLVRIDSVRKVFRARAGSEVHALRGVSLEIGRGESVGLVGESGSGKTTLGRCLVGLETATEGSIVIDGVDASDYARLTRESRTRLRGAAQIVFQDPYSSLDPMQTVGSALTEILRVNRYAGPDSRRRVSELLEFVGLPPGYAARRPSSLSGGERQRVAIARTLAVEPKLLVCDEPVSALDVSVQAQILNLFRTLRRDLGLSYLFITHDLAVVRQVVERVYVLYRGEIVEEGLVDAVLDNPAHEYTRRLVASIPRGSQPAAA